MICCNQIMSFTVQVYKDSEIVLPLYFNFGRLGICLELVIFFLKLLSPFSWMCLLFYLECNAGYATLYLQRYPSRFRGTCRFRRDFWSIPLLFDTWDNDWIFAHSSRSVQWPASNQPQAPLLSAIEPSASLFRGSPCLLPPSLTSTSSSYSQPCYSSLGVLL